MKRSEQKKLDTLWSKKVKELAGDKCEYCLKKNVWLNSCHIMGRRYRGTRWMLANGMCLCYTHHNQYDEHGPQHEDIVNSVVGRDRLEMLQRISQDVAKNQDFETIKKELI